MKVVVNVCIFKVISFVVVVDSLVHGSSIVGFPTHPHVCWCLNSEKVLKTTTPVLSALFFRPRITKVHFKETQFELRVLGKDVSFRGHVALL